jgi:hypothetical protein
MAISLMVACFLEILLMTYQKEGIFQELCLVTCANNQPC